MLSLCRFISVCRSLPFARRRAVPAGPADLNLVAFGIWTESYTFTDDLRDKIVAWAGITPTVDAFASPTNKRFPLHWEDAFQEDWSSEILWAKPPFLRMPEVIDKICLERAKGILIVPEALPGMVPRIGCHCPGLVGNSPRRTPLPNRRGDSASPEEKLAYQGSFFRRLRMQQICHRHDGAGGGRLRASPLLPMAPPEK